MASDTNETSSTAKLTFVSQSMWSSSRPETLVVCCSDGRWQAPIHEFVEHEVSERPDLFVIPGGPAAFDPWNSSFDEARVLDGALKLFAEHHDLRSVWLIQHEGCSYYRINHPKLDADCIAARQAADLCRAALLLHVKYPKFAVRAFLATLREGRAVFTELDTDSQPGSRITGVMRLKL